MVVKADGTASLASGCKTDYDGKSSDGEFPEKLK